MYLLKSNDDKEYKFSSSIEYGYSDITSILNIAKYWEQCGVDYKVARNELYKCAMLKMSNDINNWNNLNKLEKKISAIWFIVPKQLRDTVLTINEQILYSKIFDENSRFYRNLRFETCKYEIYN